MPIRKPITPDWSKRLNGYFIAFARRVFHWSPAYREAVQRAEQGERGEKRYLCESCGALVERSEKQVDHIEPVIRVGKPWSGSWDEYRDRLFVDARSLRVLCKPCHKEKTATENKERRNHVEMSKLVCQHDDPSWCTDKCPKRSPKCQTKSRKKKTV